MLPANSDDLRRKLTLIQPQRSAPASYGGVAGVRDAGVGGGGIANTTNTIHCTQDPLNATTAASSTITLSSSNLPATTSYHHQQELRVPVPWAGAGGGGGGGVGGGVSGPTCLPNVSIVNPSINPATSASGQRKGGSAGNGGGGHTRSMSHGGGGVTFLGSGSMTVATLNSAGGGGTRTIKSALKGHQRAFSQGQIIEPMASSTSTGNVMPARGHSRVGSRTEFILPPGHKDHQDEEGREFIPNSSAPPSSSSVMRIGSGHSRQASRSESIYTLRRMDTPPWWKRIRTVTGGQPEKTEERCYRIVVPNHTVPPKTPKRDHPNGLFTGNKIRTSKYTLLSFIPKNLFEQFHRVANLYFIFIVLLNWFPAINAFGKEVAMIPVLFVLGITAVKDLFEDRRRKCSDQRINNSTCRIYDGETERYKRVKWMDVRVGDIVHLSNNETVPADILLLRTSNSHGICYIDTCDLDGETNLKRREVVRGFVGKQSTFTPNKFVSRVEADAPTTKLYRFHGALLHSNGNRVSISTDCLLLRESRIKNTDFVEGIVIYAGHETKAMLNNSGPRYKRSRVEQQMNIDVIWCVIILLILCVVGALGCRMWLSSFHQFPVPYLPFPVHPEYEGLLTFWTYIIILQVMIPLSLYVTIELCKILQVYHIHNNIELYDYDTLKKTECRAMNITEELGQIQHIFSDKTGTLTENKMLFRRCVVNGNDYNHPPSELEKEYSKPGSQLPPLIVNTNFLNDLQLAAANCVSFKTQSHQQQQQQSIQEFLLVMAICNTVIVSATPHHDLMNASGLIEGHTQRMPIIEESNGAAASSGSKETRNLDVCGKEQLQQQQQLMAGTATMANHSKLASAIPADRYIRLTESRSVTPSPPPPTLVGMMANNNSNNNTTVTAVNSIQHSHIPSLSPISGSPEATTPTSESPPPPIKLKTTISSSSTSSPSHIISPTSKAKAALNSKINSLTMFLNSRTQAKRLAMKLQQQRLFSFNQNQSDGRPLYEAESPDELALVNAAYSYDCCLISRTPTHSVVQVPGEGNVEYEILKILPFDSNRKCMSIVVRRTGTSKIILYTKGADSSIMPVLATCPSQSPEATLRERTQQQLNRYAREGLRILVMAKRELTLEEYTQWLARHQKLEISMENRERQIRDSYGQLECGLTLLGATGIEDRLQEGVPETIASLLAAGISIWVLTGDKPETAINIAYSAKLFTQQMELIRLTARSRDGAEAAINFYLNDIQTAKYNNSPMKNKALVIDGKTLTYILDQRSRLIKPFLELAQKCSSVLCCRSTPLQKAYLVKVVKEELRLCTLAIGDGANDVSMIQMADVGVGISGQEGTQAVMAADFTVARFRYLERLLLTHGFWCYDRLARMILYFFYKNAAFVFLIFWYQLYCGFSGSVMMDQMYLMLYNLIFTSLPPLAIGVYDKRVSPEVLLSHPQLYKNGRLGLTYKSYDFWFVLFDAIYQSLIVFFFSLFAYRDSDVGIWEFGATITACCLYANLLHGAIEIRSWTVIHILSIVFSLCSFYLFSIIYNSMCVNCFGLPSSYWVIFHCFTSALHWLLIILTSVVAVLPRLLLTTLKVSLHPDDCTRILLRQKRERNRGEGLLVTWSRSTSASSIYRIADYGFKNQIINAMTTI